MLKKRSLNLFQLLQPELTPKALISTQILLQSAKVLPMKVLISDDHHRSPKIVGRLMILLEQTSLALPLAIPLLDQNVFQ